MSSGMTGQTPCLTSRWDKPAQPKQSVDIQQQKSSENAAHPISLSGVVSGPNSTVSQAPETGGKSPQGGVEMAAAMAAKINAMLMAKGKLLTPPPLLAKTPPSVPVPAVTEEMVVTEVDINDVPLNCRDLLTKGKTQEEIRQFSGAIVSTKGHFMTETEKGIAAGQRPLYLHVQGKTQEQVNKAVIRIKEIISEDVMRTSAASGGQQVPVIPPLTLYPQPPRPVVPSTVPRMPNTTSVPAQGHRPAAPHLGSFVHTKIFVGLDQALPSFNVKEKVEGPAGSYLSHIQTETGARVFLRGKGSGYIEQASKRESFEPLYVYISHPNAAGLESAKKLTESLLETVRAEHARMVSIYTATGSTQLAQQLLEIHTQYMDFHLIAITLARGPGITTQQMGMLAAIQRIQEPLVIGVRQMVPQVILTCRQTLHLLRQWFSIRCVLGNRIPILFRIQAAVRQWSLKDL
uniref:KH homology domain-containing protein 4 n=1 Tax=Astatotilapia calliptera TaxID=8154 RepID=A0A3P8QGI9_ASTCA